MKDLTSQLSESLSRAQSPLVVYVVNQKMSTQTKVFQSRKIDEVIDTIKFCCTHPKRAWLDNNSNVRITIIEGEHCSWENSMKIKYSITEHEYFCSGHNEEEASAVTDHRGGSDYYRWDEKTIHIHYGNTYSI